MHIATTVQTAIVGSSANAPLRYTLPHLSVALPPTGAGSSISVSSRHYRRAVSTVRARVEASAAILFNFAAAFRVSAGAPVFRCSATSCSNRLISLMLSIIWPSPTKRAIVDASCLSSTTRHLPGCSRQKAVPDCDIAAFPRLPKRSDMLLKNFHPECSWARRSKSIAIGTMPNKFEPFMKAIAIP